MSKHLQKEEKKEEEEEERIHAGGAGHKGTEKNK